VRLTRIRNFTLPAITLIGVSSRRVNVVAHNDVIKY